MKKGLLLLAITLWLIIAVLAVAAINFGVRGEFVSLMGSTKIHNAEIAVENINKIAIEGAHQSIEICETDNSVVKIYQYGSSNTSDDRLFQYSAKDGALQVYFERSQTFSFFLFNFASERLIIEIPSCFNGDLDIKSSSGNINIEGSPVLNDVNISISSGSIYIAHNIMANSVNVSASSGAINLNNGAVLSGDLSLNVSSGSIRLAGTTEAEMLNVVTKSGKIRIDTANVESYYLNTSSGGVTVESISGRGEVRTNSGSIRIALVEPNGEVLMSTSSGGITVFLESELQFEFNARSVSGGIHTDFDALWSRNGKSATAAVGDSPTVSINIETTSGGIRVSRD